MDDEEIDEIVDKMMEQEWAAEPDMYQIQEVIEVNEDDMDEEGYDVCVGFSDDDGGENEDEDEDDWRS
jgi:hypothetical protein